jgi:hypothetical protein
MRGILLLAVTLAAGVAIGVGYERRRTPAHGTAVMESHHVIHRLRDGLGLDSAQQSAIAAILARRQGTVDSTWHTLRPQLHAMLDSTLAEIVHLLRPDQVAKYRKMVEGMHPGSRHLP